MRKLRFLVFLFVLTGIASDSRAQPEQTSVEVLTVILENGTVYEGSGSEGVITDLGILGGRIVAVGDLDDRRAGLRLNVNGLAVVPGFIDIHSHARRGIYRWPDAENYIRQGVTTVIEVSLPKTPSADKIPLQQFR